MNFLDIIVVQLKFRVYVGYAEEGVGPQSAPCFTS